MIEIIIIIIKQEGLYQNKVNSRLVSISNCKMGHCCEDIYLKFKKTEVAEIS